MVGATRYLNVDYVNHHLECCLLDSIADVVVSAKESVVVVVSVKVFIMLRLLNGIFVS